MKRTLISLLTGVGLCSGVFGPARAEEANLSAQISPLDAQIFEAAFLTCDEETLRALMSDDLEFYHDLYGLIAEDLDSFTRATIPDCEARKAGELPYLERRLDIESVQIKRLGEWGAMQTGRHAFYGRDELGGEQLLEQAEFMHIWQRSDKGWQIKRVISYDHRSQ